MRLGRCRVLTPPLRSSSAQPPCRCAHHLLASRRDRLADRVLEGQVGINQPTVRRAPCMRACEQVTDLPPDTTCSPTQ